ncbi:hypothetical protein LINGRAPRIM_LOCUS2318 [Linum grandiflorum]
MSAIPQTCFIPRWTKKAKVEGSSEGTTYAKTNGECYENTMESIVRAMTAATAHDNMMYLIIDILFFILDNILIANSASIGCFLGRFYVFYFRPVLWAVLRCFACF